MNLLDFARDNGLASYAASVRAWLADLSKSVEGRAVRQNLESDDALARTSAGHAVLHDVIRHVGSWTPAMETALDWLTNLLNRRPRHFLCCGRAVPNDPVTVTVCRTMALRSVYRRLRRDDLPDEEKVFGVATGSPPDRDSLRDWGHTFLDDPRLASTVIDPDKPVRGRIPVVFATPAQDRSDLWPAGSPVGRILQILGILADVAEVTDQCVLTFRLDEVGPGHVPTGIDAHTSSFFLVASEGADWGHTHDLGEPPGPGVRECVVREFQARLVKRYEVLDA